jgi:ribose-phosphate pyrophosphokinase
VRVHAIVGEAAGRAPIIVDDMISTGGTIEAAARALLQAGCKPRIVVAASHLLLVSGAADRLARLPIQQLVGTDSVAGEPATAIKRASIAPLLAETIAWLHENRSITAIDAHG